MREVSVALQHGQTDRQHLMNHVCWQQDKGGNYSCMTDSGQLSSTATEADHWQLSWRRCVGPTLLWASVVGMLLLLSLTGLVWGVAANATRLQFLLRVFKRIKMPRRQEFLRVSHSV